jgi:hypothetical protein
VPRSTGRGWRNTERNGMECGRGSWDRVGGNVWGENRGGRFDGSGDEVVGDGSSWCHVMVSLHEVCRVL